LNSRLTDKVAGFEEVFFVDRYVQILEVDLLGVLLLLVSVAVVFIFLFDGTFLSGCVLLDTIGLGALDSAILAGAQDVWLLRNWFLGLARLKYPLKRDDVTIRQLAGCLVCGLESGSRT
jgi:hypothetical protein